MQDSEALKKLVRNISRDRLAHQAQTQQIEIHEVDGRPAVYSHWMAIILISGPGLKITFKTHFKTEVAQAMAAGIYKRAASEVSLVQATDFMRELCNLVAGATKASLLAGKVSVDLSLPIMTRGFDEIFFARAVTRDHAYDHWILRTGAGEIFCTMTADFFEKIDFSAVGTSAEPESDVEFF